VSDSLLVAIDDGYAQTKLWGKSPNGSQESVRYMMRSSVRPGRFGLVSLSDGASVGTYRTEEGEEFTVSEDIESESTQFDGFHTSPMNRVLVHHALAAAGYGGKRVTLWTGLPISDFFSRGRKDDAKIAAKRNNLMKTISHESGGDPLTELVDVRVGCQALASFYDYALDDHCQERNVSVDKVAVVDIGGRTTDVALVLDGQSLDPRRSGTENIGVLDVYSTLSELLRTEFKTRDDYPLAMLDVAVRTGSVKLWGKPQDVKHLVEKAVQEQQGKIARDLERRLGSGSDLDTVLFVGGGSALFHGLANVFPNAEVAEDSEFANARGLFKYALYVSKHEG
jgi:plasmid segregation protein ParM